MKKLNVQDLNVLLAVAETGSFRKASTRLYIGQSAVTRRIQKLEDALVSPGASVGAVGEEQTDVLKIGRRSSCFGVCGPDFEVEGVGDVQVGAYGVLDGRDLGNVEVIEGFCIDKGTDRARVPEVKPTLQSKVWSIPPTVLNIAKPVFRTGSMREQPILAERQVRDSLRGESSGP